MKPWHLNVLILAGGLAGGTVIARYTLPPKVVEKEKVVVQEKEVVKWKDRTVVEKGPVRIVTKTVTVPGPQGPTVTVERVVEKEKVVTVVNQDAEVQSNSTILTEREKTTDSRPWFAVEASGVLAPTTGRWAWTGGAQIRVLGPVWVGAGVVKADEWYVGPSARVEF